MVARPRSVPLAMNPLGGHAAGVDRSGLEIPYVRDDPGGDLAQGFDIVAVGPWVVGHWCVLFFRSLSLFS